MVIKIREITLENSQPSYFIIAYKDITVGLQILNYEQKIRVSLQRDSCCLLSIRGIIEASIRAPSLGPSRKDFYSSALGLHSFD